MLRYTTILALGVLTAVSLSSCDAISKNEEEGEEKKEQQKINYKRINVEDRYSIEVGEKMKSTSMLNDEASLQYFSVVDDKYVVIIDEPWEDIEFMFEFLDDYDPSKSRLESYADLQFESLHEMMNVYNASDWSHMKINGMDAMRITCTATLKEQLSTDTDPLAYNLAFIDGEETVYMIMSWTIESKKGEFKDEQMHMFESFKEMNEGEEEPES